MFVSYFPGWKRSDRLHLCSQIKKWGLSGFVFRGPGTFQLPPPKHHFFSGSFLLLFFPLLFLLCTLSSSHTLFLSSCTPAPFVFPSSISCVWQMRTYCTHTCSWDCMLTELSVHTDDILPLDDSNSRLAALSSSEQYKPWRVWEKKLPGNDDCSP